MDTRTSRKRNYSMLLLTEHNGTYSHKKFELDFCDKIIFLYLYWNRPAGPIYFLCCPLYSSPQPPRQCLSPTCHLFTSNLHCIAACLSIWSERFRGSQKNTSVGILVYYSFMEIVLEQNLGTIAPLCLNFSNSIFYRCIYVSSFVSCTLCPCCCKISFSKRTLCLFTSVDCCKKKQSLFLKLERSNDSGLRSRLRGNVLVLNADPWPPPAWLFVAQRAEIEKRNDPARLLCFQWWPIFMGNTIYPPQLKLTTYCSQLSSSWLGTGRYDTPFEASPTRWMCQLLSNIGQADDPGHFSSIHFLYGRCCFLVQRKMQRPSTTPQKKQS